MKTNMLALAAISALALSAQAQTYNWTLTVPTAPTKGGSGTLTLGSNGVLTAMTGKIDGGNGGNVSALLGGNLPLGNVDFVVTDKWGVSRYYGIVSNSVDIDRDFYPSTFTYTPVPEPHEYAMVACAGLVGFGLWRRRSQAASKA